MKAMEELNAQISQCNKCEISRKRNKVVPGEGNDNADILFIGEAPGFYEDQQGRPFVGQAGQFLDQLLASIGLNRRDVFIANVIKCRPPDNRDPLPTEIENCRPWINRQIEIINPRIIVTLGRYSMGMFFPGKTISKVHGLAVRRDGRIYFAMYHPAAALHQRSLQQTLLDDIKKLPGLLEEIKNIPEEKPKPTQLSMFED